MARLSWGHINVNVTRLEDSVAFYELLGFTVLMPGIPYLNLNTTKPETLNPKAAAALNLPLEATGRACIMQLNRGFPKLDLTEWGGEEETATALRNQDTGIVRMCLASQNLEQDYKELLAAGVRFLSEPKQTEEGKADIAICQDPDGSLIEIIQIYPEKWV
ncbi:MAG: VOC family protein [Pseudomonadaceae bacterium]|nr:VOC family protein [Pseudomonadaceae bacterium]